MFGFSAGKVFFDAVVLCGLLYLIARHEADIDVQKMAMVVAGTALGNLLLFVMLSERLPANWLVWVMPLTEVAFSAFMIMTFCWISFWKSLLVAVLFGVLHTGFGLAVNAGIRKVMSGASATPSLVEQQERDMQEVKAEMERLGKLQDAGGEQLQATTNAEPVPGVTGVVANAGAAAQAGATVGTIGGVATNVALPSRIDWDAARRKVRIGGISGRPGEYVAFVNQRIVDSNSVVSVTHDGKTYHWTVAEISRENVRLEPRDVR